MTEWNFSELDEIEIEWREIFEVAEIRDDVEVTQATARAYTSDAEGYFSNIELFRDLTNDRITGANVAYIPIPSFGSGTFELPVFGDVQESEIVAAHIVPKSSIIGGSGTAFKVRNKATSGDICTLTLLPDIDALAYQVTDFGPAQGLLGLGVGASLVKEGGATPELTLIIQWNLA